MPIKILMPALSPTMTEGNLVRWLKQEGDNVTAGEVLAEIETDKATMEVEAVDEGRLVRILVPEGSEGVQVNAPIAVVLEEDEDESALESLDLAANDIPQGESQREEICVTQAPSTPGEKPVLHVMQQEKTVAAPAAANNERLFATPLARRMAEAAGIDLYTLQGSGPYGRIIKYDIEQAQRQGAAPSAANAGSAMTAMATTRQTGLPAHEAIKVSGMRKVIAQRLTESKQTVPHFYLTIECELDKLLALRKDVNAALPEDQKVSINDFIIRACAVTLMRVPEANASWNEDHVKHYKAADISVAVAIEGGLVTPIVRDANLKSVTAISTEAKDLISRARNGKLMPEDFQGGTFSLSNLGMFGIDQFEAIINPPQGCILAVGAGKESVVVKEGAITTATVMKCTLSVDHRVVDGAVGARFLQELKNIIQQPILMMV